MARSLACALLALAACKHHEKRADFGSQFFSSPGDRVICSKGADRTHTWSHAALVEALEHARSSGTVLQTFGHAPTIDIAEYIPEFDWAAAHQLPMVTYRELATRRGGGWAFTIDDDEVDAWWAWRDLLRAHRVHATFFVSHVAALTPAQIEKLKALAADGHDIEAHGVGHENATEYVRAHGLAAYVRDEVLPSRDALAAAGFATPVAFAYPYGAHDEAIDAALLPEFAVLRLAQTKVSGACR